MFPVDVGAFLRIGFGVVEFVSDQFPLVQPDCEVALVVVVEDGRTIREVRGFAGDEKLSPCAATEPI
jgi:hypothetical protein